MAIELGQEIEAEILSRVASGRYATAAEVVAEGLSLLDQPEEVDEEKLAALRGEIQKGDDSVARDGVIPSEVVFARLRDLSESRKRELHR